MKKIITILLVIIIFSCNSTKLPISKSEDILLLKNRNILKNHFKNKALKEELFDIDRQRKNIVNTLSFSELESDTLVIYETIFSHSSTNYNCVVYNSRFKSFKSFSEKSQQRLTKNGIMLDTVKTLPRTYICLINKILKNGVYKSDELSLPNIGGRRYSFLTIAIKDFNGIYELTSRTDIYPPLDCEE